MDSDEAATTEYEIERQKWNLDQPETNLDHTPSRLGCTGLILRLVIGVIIWRLILEILSICV